MRPDRLPDGMLEVNGFRHMRSNEYFVEWRDVTGDRVSKVWVRMSDGYRWSVNYEVTVRGSERVLEQGGLGTYEETEQAVSAAVDFMQKNGSGTEDLTGSFPNDLDFSGVGR